MSKVILASQSPRRKKLLSLMGINFDVIPSDVDEMLDDGRPAGEVAVELAVKKAEHVAEKYPEAIVIGSDTIVANNGRQLDKPRNNAGARAMLKELSGRASDIFTSIAVIRKSDNTKITALDNSKIHLKPLDMEIVESYIATGSALDKSGSLGVEGGGDKLIDYIEGRYDTTLGLPTEKLAEILNRLGVSCSPAKTDPTVKIIEKSQI